MVLKCRNNWVAFMAHLPREEFDNLEKELEECNLQRYIISHEVANNGTSHFHFLCQPTEGDLKFYDNFRKRNFIDKYKLRGQPKKDLPRQYGKVRDINELDKMASYTIKDEDFRVMNISQEEIDDMIDNAFNKTDKVRLLKDKMIEYVESKLCKGNFTIYAEHEEIVLIIIRFCFENKIEVRRSLLDSYYYHFRQFSTKKELQYSPSHMYNAIYKQMVY
jgi:hypothetical protein